MPPIPSRSSRALADAGYRLDKVVPSANSGIAKLLFALIAIGFLSGMTYGPVAALLVELFPARIRYTSLSVPYHLGTGYFGGFLPLISQYIVARTGDPFAGHLVHLRGHGDGAGRDLAVAARDGRDARSIERQVTPTPPAGYPRARVSSSPPLRLTLDGDALVANWRWFAQRRRSGHVRRGGEGRRLWPGRARRRAAAGGGRVPRLLRHHLGRGRGAESAQFRRCRSRCCTGCARRICPPRSVVRRVRCSTARRWWRGGRRRRRGGRAT